MNQQILILFLSWIVYFIFHSLLASLWFKEKISSLCQPCLAGYRLVYNILATVLLLVPLFLLLQWKQGLLWQWQGGLAWGMNGLALIALLGFLWTLKYYDMAEFFGLKQFKILENVNEDQEQFTLSPLHRFVRHPWYFFALVILWTRSMDVMMLVSAIAMSLYFIIGSWLEERKLVQYHGDLYRRYQKKVPSLIPNPWCYLQPGEKL